MDLSSTETIQLQPLGNLAILSVGFRNIQDPTSFQLLILLCIKNVLYFHLLRFMVLEANSSNFQGSLLNYRIKKKTQLLLPTSSRPFIMTLRLWCGWFSCCFIADMLVDVNKRSLIISFCSSTSNCTLNHCYLCL